MLTDIVQQGFHLIEWIYSAFRSFGLSEAGATAATTGFFTLAILKGIKN